MLFYIYFVYTTHLYFLHKGKVRDSGDATLAKKKKKKGTAGDPEGERTRWGGAAGGEVLKVVQMEYLYHSAPLFVRSLAAGLHQRAQNSGEATSVADFYSVLVGMSRDNTSTSGSGILSETELWHSI
jgi:hypothetical protein